MKIVRTGLQLALGLSAALAMASAASAATVVSVPGSSDPFLAGQPSGTNCCSGDSAPAQSPVLALTNPLAGSTLTFSTTGGASYTGGTPSDSADGDNDGTNYTYRYDMSSDYGTGISGAKGVNIDALVGVFVSGTPSGPAPAQLDFTASGSSTGLDFTSLSPGLNQIFFIGDGLTGLGAGTTQDFIVPTGATALYLGTADGFGWYNNSGTIVATINSSAVSAAPEPESWALMLLGVGGAGLMLRRARKASGRFGHAVAA